VFIHHLKDGGGSGYLWNVSAYLSMCTVSHPWRCNI
jgi:hypothetical protein